MTVFEFEMELLNILLSFFWQVVMAFVFLQFTIVIAATSQDD